MHQNSRAESGRQSASFQIVLSRRRSCDCQRKRHPRKELGRRPIRGHGKARGAEQRPIGRAPLRHHLEIHAESQNPSERSPTARRSPRQREEEHGPDAHGPDGHQGVVPGDGLQGNRGDGGDGPHRGQDRPGAQRRAGAEEAGRVGVGEDFDRDREDSAAHAESHVLEFVRGPTRTALQVDGGGGRVWGAAEGL